MEPGSAHCRTGLYESKINNGKALYENIKNELKQVRKEENDLIEIVMDYLFKKQNSELDDLGVFLERELNAIKQ